MDRKEKIKAIADHYGYDAQSRQCIEEMAELTQAINKFWRKQLGCGKNELSINPIICDDVCIMSNEYDNLIEEIADVEICLEQLKYLLKVNLSSIIENKLDRQLERIEANENH